MLAAGGHVGSPTCQSRADASTVHGAVTGAGLVHHVVEAQLLGVACTQNADKLASEAPA